MADHANRSPDAEAALAELIRVTHEAIYLVGAAIRGESVQMHPAPDGAVTVSVAERLALARHVLQSAPALAERLAALRPHGGAGGF